MKIIHFSSPAEIQARFEQMEVDPAAREIMLEKFEFIIIDIPSVQNVAANIIKQEMLVLGGEAAVHRHTISCKVPSTPVLLAGTKKTYRKLIERLQHQVGELPQIAGQLQELLF